jgi:hypothetical protein
MSEAQFSELEASRQALEAILRKGLSPEQQDALDKIRAADQTTLDAQRAAADAQLSAQIAEIVKREVAKRNTGFSATPMLGQPARVVGHHTLVCKNCGQSRDADDQSKSNAPSAGGCNGVAHQSHDFYGTDTEIYTVSKLEPHHAVHIPA